MANVRILRGEPRYTQVTSRSGSPVGCWPRLVMNTATPPPVPLAYCFRRSPLVRSRGVFRRRTLVSELARSMWGLLVLLSAPALPAQGGINPSEASGPLVITVYQDARPVARGTYRVCVGTARDWEAYGMVATDNFGQAQFPNAPANGELRIHVEKSTRSSVMHGATLTYPIGPSRRELTVHLVPGLEVSCPGAPTRSIPEWTDSTGIVGTLQHTGTPIAVSRTLTFFTTTAGGVRALNVRGFASEYRTKQDEGGFSDWRRATQGQGMLSGVTHQITGEDARKTVTLQLRNGNFAVSPMYSVSFDFVDMYFCTLQYRRADHALAPPGVPEGAIGVETVRLQRGVREAFDTTWPSPNEKRPGFGMHLRTAIALGGHAVELTVRRGGITETTTLAPGVRQVFAADLVSARCL